MSTPENDDHLADTSAGTSAATSASAGTNDDDERLLDAYAERVFGVPSESPRAGKRADTSAEEAWVDAYMKTYFPGQT